MFNTPPSRALISLLVTPLILAGCNGSSNESGDTPAPLQTGVFLDSPVKNIGYSTETITGGITNENGEFQYRSGETITFAIGSLKFPAVAAQNTVTPLDLGITTTNPIQVTSNILRLLQTLDKDGDPSNGITLTEDAKVNAAPAAFDLASNDFATLAEIDRLVRNGGQDTTVTELVSKEAANSHFNETLRQRGKAFTPTEFTGNRFIGRIEPDGTRQFFTQTFHADNTYHTEGLVNADSLEKTGLYSFELNYQVIRLDVSTGDEPGETHPEFIVLKSIIGEMQNWNYCKVDDERVITASAAYKLCKQGDTSNSEGIKLLEGDLQKDIAVPPLGLSSTLKKIVVSRV
ncbi:hypothetical protein [Marinobacterium jannaschii]|uniref:hypothetical protein n=1 Tax=Marinobacterium jannaschii TaxID=64970 RepID=UPI000686D89A|nr:hypothetical protein [Marinobacterium jannaschii]